MLLAGIVMRYEEELRPENFIILYKRIKGKKVKPGSPLLIIDITRNCSEQD